MTNGEKIMTMFPNAKVRNSYYTYCVEVKLEYHSQYDTGLLFDKKWWNAEYKEPIIEHEQNIDKSSMMQEIYMEGVNMGGEYQGCWVRFKEIEKIIDKYVR